MNTPPEDANGNANGNAETVRVPVPVPEGDPVGIPLADAAARLGVTRPRLSRLLRQPELAAGLTKGPRKTRTGTRTVTFVSVPVLEAARRLLAEGEREQERERGQDPPGRARSRSRSAEASSAGASEEPDGLLPAPVYQKLLADKEAEIRYLRDQLRLSQENLAREQVLRMQALPAPAESGGADLWARIRRLFGA